jgi:hypothetical protein
MTPLAPASSFGNSRANGISDDGNVIFGLHNSLAAIFVGGAPVSLGDLPGGAASSYPLGASGDGNVIVGGSSSENSGFLGNEAFLWSSVTGIMGLGDLPDPPFGSVANAVAANGVVVGSADIDPFGGSTPKAFIWDFVNGMRDLRSVLVSEYGLASALANWSLISATGISSDGKTIAGTGFGPNGEEAWIVRLDVAAPACFGDIDGDGKTCQSDLGILLAAFGTCECQTGYIARANLATSTPANCPAGAQGIDQADLGVLLSNFGCGECP